MTDIVDTIEAIKEAIQGYHLVVALVGTSDSNTNIAVKQLEEKLQKIEGKYQYVHNT